MGVNPRGGAIGHDHLLRDNSKGASYEGDAADPVLRAAGHPAVYGSSGADILTGDASDDHTPDEICARDGVSSVSIQDLGSGIPCFTPGTHIATERGSQPIENLSVGDRVFTRDHGLQPIRWIGRRVVKAKGQYAPVLIRPSVFTNMTAPLLVSPRHRILFTGYRAELLFGETEVLVEAKQLVDGSAVTFQLGGDITYVHLMFDYHEVIYANGVPTESFHPRDEALSATDPKAREELLALFPQLRTGDGDLGRTARRCLKGFEADMLLM